MVSAVAARLIPKGDVDKEHNSDDQERLDRQDYFLLDPDEDPENAGKKIGDDDKEHNSDDQERLDRQDYFLLDPDEDPENAGKKIDELMGGGNDIVLPGHHHRAAHGCVQWGEPCTRETNCCGDSNYEGI